MAIENMRVIGDVLYDRRPDGKLYPVRRVPPTGLLSAPSDTQGSATGFPELDRMLVGLGNLNQMFNPVESIGQSMAASRRIAAPDTAGWDRVAAFGDMLSGVAGVTAPVAAAARAGTPAAVALMEGLLGGSPTMTAAKDTARTVARTVAERANQRGPVPTMGSNFGNLLGDVGEASTGKIVNEKIGNSTVSYQVGDNGVAEIFSVKTPQNKRGQGSAKAAMSDLLSRFDAMGVNDVRLIASPLDKKTSGKKLVDFYKGLGFNLTGERANMAGDPWMSRTASSLPAPRNEAEAIAKGIRAYHTTEKPFEAYDWSKLGVNTGYQTEGTSVGDWAANLAKIGPWAHEAPLSSKMGGYDLPIDISGKGKKFKSLDALERSVVKAGGPEQFRSKLVSEGFGHIRVADEEFKGTSFVGLSPENFAVNAQREGNPLQGLLSMGSK